MKFIGYLMALALCAESTIARRGTQSQSRGSAPHSSFHSVHHSSHASAPPRSSFVQRPHQAHSPPSYHPAPPRAYHPSPQVSHAQQAYHPHNVSGQQILSSHSQPQNKIQSLPQAPSVKKTVTTTSSSTYIPPPKRVVTTYHVSHVQTPRRSVYSYADSYEPYYPSGFNMGGTHIHLNLGMPTFLGGQGLYETGPEAYGETHWTHHHYHRSSVLGEIIVLSIFLCILGCMIMICCAMCKSESEENGEYMEEYEEEQMGLVQHQTIKKEEYENYVPHHNEPLQDHEEEIIEYIQHPDGGMTEKRTVKHTQYDFGHEKTQASQGPMSSYGMQFNNQNQNMYPQFPQQNSQQYNYQYHNQQQNHMQ